MSDKRDYDVRVYAPGVLLIREADLQRLQAIVEAADKLAKAARAWRDTPEVDQWSMDIEIQIHDDLMACTEEYDAVRKVTDQWAGEAEPPG